MNNGFEDSDLRPDVVRLTKFVREFPTNVDIGLTADALSETLRLLVSQDKAIVDIEKDLELTLRNIPHLRYALEAVQQEQICNVCSGKLNAMVKRHENELVNDTERRNKKSLEEMLQRSRDLRRTAIRYWVEGAAG